jgi:hypothetical protein
MSAFVNSFSETVKDSPYALPGVVAAGLGVGWWLLSRSRQQVLFYFACFLSSWIGSQLVDGSLSLFTTSLA